MGLEGIRAVFNQDDNKATPFKHSIKSIIIASFYTWKRALYGNKSTSLLFISSKSHPQIMTHHQSKYTTAILSTILIMLVLTVPSMAQSGSELWLTNGFGHFFMSVIAGVFLAFAFQFLLTNLAVASGITAIGDIRDRINKPRSTSSESDDDDSTPIGVKISTGFGLYLTITMAISLFFASLIAVKLSLTPNNTIGFTLGLVIWAGYLLLALYIDSKMISTLTGSILSTIKDALSTGSEAVGNLFSSSDKSRMKDTTRETVRAIHDEVREKYDLSGIQNKLDEYVNKLEPRELDIENMKEQLAELIQEIQVREEYDAEDPDTIKHLFLEVSSQQPHISEKDKEKLKSVFDEAKEIKRGEGSKTDKVMAAVDKFSPGSSEEGKKYREKIEQYLRETNEEELHPDKLKQDLDEILNNPKAAPEVLQARASKIDRSTLKSLISNMEGMTEQKAEKYVSKAEETLDFIKSKTSNAQSSSVSAFEAGKNKSGGAKEAIQQWFDRMDRPELRYDRLKHDIKQMMDDPKTAPSVLKERLRQLDRESLIALVSNNSKIDRQQAERIANKIEEGRNEVLAKVDEIEREVKEKTEKIKQETLWQIEAARETAAAAAWWIFFAAVVSGGASALGGILALTG